MLDRRIWQRGMLDRAVLVPHRAAPEAWAATENDDRSATLRALDQGAAPASDHVAFVSRRGLRGLRTLTEQSKDEPKRAFFAALEGVTLPDLTTLRVSSLSRLSELGELEPVLATSFPSLARLELLAIPEEGAARVARALLEGQSFGALES